MKDPAFLFYASDFLTGCANLTMEERGKYITLLCLQHQVGHLSEKTIKLNINDLTEDLISKFELDDKGNYYNNRLEIEIEKRSLFVDSRRENGAKGGRPKKPNGKPNAKPSGKPKGEAKNNLHVNRDVNIVLDKLKEYLEEKYIDTDTSRKTISKLLKEYNINEIVNAVKWAKNDDFWTKQILSPNKLDKSNKDGIKYIDVFLQYSKDITSSVDSKYNLPKGVRAATESEIRQCLGDEYTYRENVEKLGIEYIWLEKVKQCLMIRTDREKPYFVYNSKIYEL